MSQSNQSSQSNELTELNCKNELNIIYRLFNENGFLLFKISNMYYNYDNIKNIKDDLINLLLNSELFNKYISNYTEFGNKNYNLQFKNEKILIINEIDANTNTNDCKKYIDANIIIKWDRSPLENTIRWSCFNCRVINETHKSNYVFICKCCKLNNEKKYKIISDDINK
jgi:hypothetical protein